MSRAFIVLGPALIYAVLSGATIAHAQTSPERLVLQIFNFGLAIGGLLAFGMIVYAGFRYVVAAGNPSTQGDAKDQIWQAIIGIFLLLFSGVLLQVLNPQLAGPLSIGKLDALPATPEPEVCTEQCPPNTVCVAQGGTSSCVECTLECGNKACLVGPGGSMSCEDCPSVTQESCEKEGKVCILGAYSAFTCAAKECGQDFGSCCPGSLSCDQICNFYPGIGGGGAYKCDPVSSAASPPPLVTNPQIPAPTATSSTQPLTEWACGGTYMTCMLSYDSSTGQAGLCTPGDTAPAMPAICSGSSE